MEKQNDQILVQKLFFFLNILVYNNALESTGAASPILLGLTCEDSTYIVKTCLKHLIKPILSMVCILLFCDVNSVDGRQ